MNTSSDSAEQIVKMSLEGFQVLAKVSGTGAKDVAALIYAVMKDNQKTKGKTRLTNMLKSGKELKVFSVKSEDFKKFSDEGKRYGILYCVIKNKRENTNDGIIDIIVRAEDAPKINRIVEKFKLSQYDETVIRSEIQKTKESLKIKNEENQEKDDPILNPNLAKTEKSPQSEPSLEMQKNLDQGTRVFNKRTSVKEKLEKAKETAEEINNSRKKSKVTEHIIQNNKKKRKKRSR